MRARVRLVCAIALAAVIESCSSGGSTTTPPSVASVSISQTSANLAPGATLQLTATPLDAGGVAISGETVIWATSAATVATVSTSGLVSAVAVGTATITASTGGKSVQAAITVASPVTSIALSSTSAFLVPGATSQFTAAAKDVNGATVAGQTITWSSNAGAIATVSTSGLVTGLAVGSAVITAADGAVNATIAITVGAGGVVGAAGGTVTSTDGNATVTIPPGALAANTNISIAPTSAAPTTPVAVGQGYDFLPSGTQFSVPVTIKLNYNPALVPSGHAAGALQMRTLAAGTWNQVGTPVVDSVAHTITSTTSHFSTYISTDPRLTYGVRDGDDFTAVKASSMSVSVCLNATKHVVVLSYDPGLTGTPSYTWGPGVWAISAGSTLPSPTVYGVDVVIHGDVLGGPTDLIVTVGGESATLHVTVKACMPLAITYTQGAGSTDNAFVYNNGASTALTTNGISSKVSTRADGLGASVVYNNGTMRMLAYLGIGGSLRASLMAPPLYTTSGFIESVNWVSPTQYEFAEFTGQTGVFQLYRLNTDGSPKTPFAAAGTAAGSAREPYVAGNGFTYFTYQPTTVGSSPQVYRVDANGANMTPLMTVSGQAFTPTVSQDGRWIAVSVYNGASVPIMVYDLSNLQAAPIQINPNGGQSYYPSFCGSGVLYYSFSADAGTTWTLYRWDMASRASTQVAFVGNGSTPEGVSIQPQKGLGEHSCPK